MLAETGGAVTASSDATAIVASGSTNTKGAYVELIASTTFAAEGMLISFGPQGGVVTTFLVDVAIGGAGSEVVVIPNIMTGQKDASELQAFIVPFFAPAGSRISARCQAGSASAGKEMIVTLLDRWLMPFTRYASYGVNTGTSRGASVDAGGTANTKGAYTQITASTTNPTRAFWLLTGWGSDNTRTTCNWLVDVAIGAAASEQVIIPNLLMGCHGNHDTPMPNVFGPFLCEIPTGTRLSVRAQCSINTAGDRAFDATILGVD